MATQRRTVLAKMLNALHPAVRGNVDRRCEAMLRELDFLRERQNENLTYLRSKGWVDERLQVLFVLNSVYQLCIGPLQSSARINAGLGGDYPIRHGADVFDIGRAGIVIEMVTDFFSMAADLGFLRDWMTKNTCGDLIYWIARHERDLEALQE